MAFRGMTSLRVRCISLATLTRPLSTTTIKYAGVQESVKTPVQVFGLEGRYAHALFSAASKKKVLTKVEDELKDFQKQIQDSSTLFDFMKNPTITKQQKQAVLNDILKSKKYSDLTVNFFGALADNNRLTKVPSVIKAFGTIMSAYRGEVTCTVTTAKPLVDKNIKEVEIVLQGFLNKGEKLSVDYKVDPSLIGGMIVDIGDKYIDMSTATKIKKIVNSMEHGL